MLSPLHKALLKVKIDLLGFPYRVKFVKEMFEKFGVFGCGGIAAGEIDLDNDVTNADLMATLLHEMLELMVRKTETRVEHDIITKFEVFFFSLMANNPELMRLMIDEIEKAKKAKVKPTKTGGTKKAKKLVSRSKKEGRR